MAQNEPAVAVPEASEDRHEAISEILRELRGDTASEPSSEANPTGPPAGEPQTPPAAPVGGEQDEAARRGRGEKPVAGPPASDSLPELAPRQRQASTADPRPVPQASTPRTLILLHAFLLAVFAVGTWLTYRQVSHTLSALVTDVRERSAAPAPAAPSVAEPARPPAPPAAPKARAAEPALRGDEGIRYLQEVEKADLLFQKEQYREAAAAYQRAIEVAPLDFNDGAAAFHLGECCLRLKDYPRAIAAFESVATAYPSLFQPKALCQLGRVHLELRAYPKAREAFYALLLRRARYGSETAPLVEEATYRVADTYWLEAEALASSRRGVE